MVPRGRYALYGEIGKGGMARVHVGRRYGDGGFTSTVAIKRVAPDLADVPEAIEMLADEARIASRVSHANVVATHDVVVHEGELFLVMEHVMGASVLTLLKNAILRKQKMPPEVARAIAVGMLRGLHAAHEAKAPSGEPLGIVHRDVSPSNVLVGADGVARIVDFGVAKAAHKASQTRVGERKGKMGFMSPEQLEGKPLDRRSDVWSVGIVYWEMLVHERLFGGDEDEIRARLAHAGVVPPSAKTSAATDADDAIVIRALGKERSARFASAAEMADAIEDSGVAIAKQSAVVAFVEDFAQRELAERRALLEEMNRSEPAVWIGVTTPSRTSAPPPAPLAELAVAATPSPRRSVPPDVRGPFAEPPQRADGLGRLAYLFAGFGVVLVAVAATVLVMRSSERSDANATTTANANATATEPAAATDTAPPIANDEPPAPSATTPPRRKKPRAKPGCNPPYTVDSHGVKLFKEECFE